MEVLASIPPSPSSVTLASLVADGLLDSVERWTRVKINLEMSGITTLTSTRYLKPETRVSIHRDSWPLAKSIAESYWNRTYKN